MTSKYVSVVLFIALGAALSTPARADSLKSNGNDIVIGVVAALAGVVVTVLVAVHYSKKRAITGCVVSRENGMSVTDEKDGQVYSLTGNMTGIKSGDRMKLRGKKAKSKGADKGSNRGGQGLRRLPTLTVI
ncbi:MAG: hypothetical protein ABSF85_16340 [Terriglobales bacterium]|jgi:hypothetical protein